MKTKLLVLTCALSACGGDPTAERFSVELPDGGEVQTDTPPDGGADAGVVVVTLADGGTTDVPACDGAQLPDGGSCGAQNCTGAGARPTESLACCPGLEPWNAGAGSPATCLQGCGVGQVVCPGSNGCVAFAACTPDAG